MLIKLKTQTNRELVVNSEYITCIESWSSNGCNSQLWVVAGAGYRTKSYYFTENPFELKELIDELIDSKGARD